MEKTFARRGRLALALSLAAFAGLALPAPAVAQDWPSRPINVVVPFDTGGSNDRMVRALAPYLTEELGQPLSIVNRPGANTLLGHTFFLQQPGDGHTLLATSASIYIASNIVLQGADFTLDDFAFINMPWIATSMIITSKDSRFETFDDFVAEVREKPGTVTIGMIPRSADALNVTLMLESLGLPEDALRIVTYDGGGPLRSAVAGGVLDAIVADATGNLTVGDLTRGLVTFGEERDGDWAETPSIVEMGAEMGFEPRFTYGSIRGFAAPAEFRDSNPEGWEKLVAAFKTASENPEAQAALASQNIPLVWRGPEESTRLIQDSLDILTQYREHFEE